MSLGPSVPAKNKRRKTEQTSSSAESKQNQPREKVKQLLTEFLDLGNDKLPIRSDKIYNAFNIEFKKDNEIESRYEQQDAEEAYGQMLRNLGLYDTLCRTNSTYFLGENDPMLQNLSYPTSRDFVLKGDENNDQYYEFQTLTSLQIYDELTKKTKTKTTVNNIKDDCEAMLLSPERRGVSINRSPIKVIKNQLPSKYKLKSIILKSGSERSGHFVCIVGRGDKWYFIDDDEIREVHAFSENDYIKYDSKYDDYVEVVRISLRDKKRYFKGRFFIRSLLFFNTELAPSVVLKNTSNKTYLRLKNNSLPNMTIAQKNVIGNYNKVFWSSFIVKQLSEKEKQNVIAERRNIIKSTGDYMYENKNYIYLKRNEMPLPRVFANIRFCSEKDNIPDCANQCYLIAMFNSMMIPYNGWPYITK